MKNVELLKANGVDVDKSLELFGEMDMYNDTMNDFLNEVHRKISDIKRYKEASDMANYAIMVHSLKSDAKYLGFTKLAELAYDHELKSKANDRDYCFNNFDSLMKEAERIIKLCEVYMGVSESLEVEQVPVKDIDKAILVVDDSNLVVNFIGKIFEDTFEVMKALDGEEAIRRIVNDKEDKIVGMLLDLNMPNVDGFQVLDYFVARDLFNKIPVSVVTGGDDKETISKVYKYPIVELLIKPCNERDIKHAVEKMVARN